jgi:hypothetical protein
MNTFIKICLILCMSIIIKSTYGEDVYVQYRGNVNLDKFVCRYVSSSLVNRICFDRRQSYMVISLKGNYYHYCGIDEVIVKQLINADSVGRYFNEKIRGQFDCRTGFVPRY